MRTWLKIALALLVLCFLGFLVFAFFRTDRRQSALRLTRADGVIVTIESATFGTNHVFQHGSKLLGRIYTYVPDVIKKWLGTPVEVTQSASEPVLLIWYSLFDPATAGYISPNQDSFQIIDEHGCVFPIHRYGSGVTTPTYSVHYAYVEVFPRRQKTFTFRPKFANTPALEFQIPNPIYSVVKQEWKPEPLPATRAFGDTNFTLSSIKGHFYNSGNWFSSKFTISQESADRTGWFAPLVKYIDATGNSGYAICPYEPAWKVQVDFFHSHKAPFPEEAIHHIPKIDTPKPGDVVAISGQIKIGDATVRALTLCGPGDYHFVDGVSVAATPWQSSWAGESHSFSSSGTRTDLWFRKKQHFLIAQIANLTNREELLIRAKDENGEFFGATFNGSASDTYQYTLQLPTNSHRLALEFIAEKPFRAEYFVAPPRPKK